MAQKCHFHDFCTIKKVKIWYKKGDFVFLVPSSSSTKIAKSRKLYHQKLKNSGTKTAILEILCHQRPKIGSSPFCGVKFNNVSKNLI